jgi:serine protease inhibitor
MRSIKLFLVFLLLALSAQSVYSLSKILPNFKDKSSEEVLVEVDLTEDINRFGFELFNLINTEKGKENIFISPLSIALALQMVNNGAERATLEEINSVLNNPEVNRLSLNNAYQKLQEKLLSKDEKVDFTIANSIWHDYNFIFNQEFLDVNNKYFNAYIKDLNFRSLSAADEINKWVSENTREKINKIVGPEIDPLTVMYLINAIYFKGAWQKEFDLKRTRFGTFQPDISCKMMSITDVFPYFEHERFQSVQLAYGDSDFAMTIFLPKRNENLDDLIEYINDLRWDYFKDQLKTAEGFLQMPRFTLEYELSLNNILQDMGMASAFTPNADFSGITSEELFISEVKHKTFIQVNEEGTEAAAVTSIGMETVSHQEPDFVMRVDRPYIYFIHFNDLVIFMGKMIHPVD